MQRRTIAGIALALLLGLLGGTVSPAAAQTSPASASAPAVTSSGETGAPRAERFNPERATEAYLARLGPAQRARSNAYFEGGYWLTLWSFLYGLGIAWLLLGTRLSARMRDLAERLTRVRPLQTFLYVVQYVLVTALLGFPWAVYTDFVREHQYGMATQDFPAWLSDQLKGLALGLVLGGLALTLLYAVLRWQPRTW